MKTDEEIIEEIIRSAIVSIPEKYLPRVEDTIDFYNKFSPALIKLANDCFKHARESEREKTRTETVKEIFEKLEKILGYDAKGEDETGKLERLKSQISRIKETAFKEGCLKAKQEVFDEIDKNGQQAICYLCKGRPSHLEYYNEIKKKHGVD